MNIIFVLCINFCEYLTPESVHPCSDYGVWFLILLLDSRKIVSSPLSSYVVFQWGHLCCSKLQWQKRSIEKCPSCFVRISAVSISNQNFTASKQDQIILIICMCVCIIYNFIVLFLDNSFTKLYLLYVCVCVLYIILLCVYILYYMYVCVCE